MFGKKKEQLPAGTRLMHYEGLPGFMQDSPCLYGADRRGLAFSPGGWLNHHPAVGKSNGCRHYGGAAFCRKIPWHGLEHLQNQRSQIVCGDLIHHGQKRCGVVSGWQGEHSHVGTQKANRGKRPKHHPVKQKSRRGLTLSGFFHYLFLLLICMIASLSLSKPNMAA